MKIQDRYAEYLKSYEWDAFGTITANYGLTFRSARSCMTRVFVNLKPKFSVVRLYWVEEHFRHTDSYHVHFLFYVDAPITYREKDRMLFVALQNATGGKINQRSFPNICHLRKYKKAGGCEEYICKDILRHASDYDFFGEW